MPPTVGWLPRKLLKANSKKLAGFKLKIGSHLVFSSSENTQKGQFPAKTINYEALCSDPGNWQRVYIFHFPLGPGGHSLLEENIIFKCRGLLFPHPPKKLDHYIWIKLHIHVSIIWILGLNAMLWRLFMSRWKISCWPLKLSNLSSRPSLAQTLMEVTQSDDKVLIDGHKFASILFHYIRDTREVWSTLAYVSQSVMT